MVISADLEIRPWLYRHTITQKYRFLDVYNFVRDRIRGVWQDLTVQHCPTHRGTIESLEISCRFLLLSEALLTGDSEFDVVQNGGLLSTCLDKLMNSYVAVREYKRSKAWRQVQSGQGLSAAAKRLSSADLKKLADIVVYESPYEDEFWSYRLVLSLSHGSSAASTSLSVLTKMPAKLLETSELIGLAYEAVNASREENARRYFKVLHRCPPLLAALMTKYANVMRLCALRALASPVLKKQETATRIPWTIFSSILDLGDLSEGELSKFYEANKIDIATWGEDGTRFVSTRNVEADRISLAAFPAARVNKLCQVSIAAERVSLLDPSVSLPSAETFVPNRRESMGEPSSAFSKTAQTPPTKKFFNTPSPPSLFSPGTENLFAMGRLTTHTAPPPLKAWVSPVQASSANPCVRTKLDRPFGNLGGSVNRTEADEITRSNQDDVPHFGTSDEFVAAEEGRRSKRKLVEENEEMERKKPKGVVSEKTDNEEISPITGSPASVAKESPESSACSSAGLSSTNDLYSLLASSSVSVDFGSVLDLMTPYVSKEGYKTCYVEYSLCLVSEESECSIQKVLEGLFLGLEEEDKGAANSGILRRKGWSKASIATGEATGMSRFFKQCNVAVSQHYFKRIKRGYESYVSLIIESIYNLKNSPHLQKKCVPTPQPMTIWCLGKGESEAGMILFRPFVLDKVTKFRLHNPSKCIPLLKKKVTQVLASIKPDEAAIGPLIVFLEAGIILPKSHCASPSTATAHSLKNDLETMRSMAKSLKKIFTSVLSELQITGFNSLMVYPLIVHHNVTASWRAPSECHVSTSAFISGMKYLIESAKMRFQEGIETLRSRSTLPVKPLLPLDFCWSLILTPRLPFILLNLWKRRVDGKDLKTTVEGYIAELLLGLDVWTDSSFWSMPLRGNYPLPSFVMGLNKVLEDEREEEQVILNDLTVIRKLLRKVRRRLEKEIAFKKTAIEVNEDDPDELQTFYRAWKIVRCLIKSCLMSIDTRSPAKYINVAFLMPSPLASMVSESAPVIWEGRSLPCQFLLSEVKENTQTS